MTSQTAAEFVAERLTADHPEIADPTSLGAWVAATMAEWFAAKTPGPEDVLGNGWNVPALQALADVCQQAATLISGE